MKGQLLRIVCDSTLVDDAFEAYTYASLDEQDVEDNLYVVGHGDMLVEIATKKFMLRVLTSRGLRWIPSWYVTPC